MSNEDNKTVYSPEPKSERTGIALCLSGGGFRASLFHLGTLRRLHELGILEKIDTLSSVSGGSIISAHLANVLSLLKEENKSITHWEEEVSLPFRNFARKDIRTWPTLKRFLFPWNWIIPSVQTKALIKNYKSFFKLKLNELPQKLNFIFCATDIIFGVNWIFEKKRVGDYQAGYIKPAPEWPVAYAVTASSSFPPVFDPVSLLKSDKSLSGGEFPNGEIKNKLISKLRLSDGGVYDNLGTEPVWKSHKIILVSDGGAPFRYETNKTILGRIFRCLSVNGKQSEAIRRRWLISNFKEDIMNGAFWGIGGSVKSYNESFTDGYSKELSKDFISMIRTDLDSFSEAEASVLENHGYLLAEAAIQEHLPDMNLNEAPIKNPLP